MYDTQSREQVQQTLMNANGKPFSEYQLNVLNETTGQCIISGAGSGKTFTMTNLIAEKIISGEIWDSTRILCTTYSKGGAEEMTNRLSSLLERCGRRERPKVSTLHATYYNIIEVCGGMSLKGKVMTESEKMGAVREACKQCGIRLEQEDLETLANLFAVQINGLLSDSDLYNSYKYTLDEIELTKYSELRSAFSTIKQQRGKIDFEDMQFYVYTWLCVVKYPNVIQYCQNMFDYYFVDEFQDTNKIQFEILKVMVKDKTKLVVIGDDDQCIYGWREADPSIILNISAYYNMAKHILPINYRCLENIVRYAASGVEKMSWREPKDIQANKLGGTVEIHDVPTGGAYGHMHKMSIYVRDMIMSLCNDKNNPMRLGDIAVLVRNNKDAEVLCALMYAAGTPCRTMEGMKISNDPIMKDVMELLERRRGVQPTYSNLLWKLIPFLGTKGSKLITDIMQGCGGHIEDAIYTILMICQPSMVSGIEGTYVDLPPKVRSRVEYMNMKFETLEGLKAFLSIITEKNDTAYAIDIIKALSIGIGFMYKKQAATRHLDSVISLVIDMLEADGFEKTLGTLRYIRQRESASGAMIGSVNIGTMHSSKGKEWKMVILLGNDNLTLPSYEAITAYEEKGIDANGIGEYIDGERRLAYVAKTRAIERLVMVCDIRQLSAFDMESLNIFKKVDGKGNNNYIIKLANKTKSGFLEENAYNVLIDNLQNSGSMGIFLVKTQDYMRQYDEMVYSRRETPIQERFPVAEVKPQQSTTQTLDSLFGDVAGAVGFGGNTVPSQGATNPTIQADIAPTVSSSNDLIAAMMNSGDEEEYESDCYDYD